jgi:hypothetical protein
MLGQTLSGRYRIERIVGEGGMGTVYAVEHMHMRKRLAVKILHPEMSRLPEVVARFEREAMAAAHIDHPNVAAATDFGKLEDGSFFLVLEYVEGKSLREAIAVGRLELGRALHILGQIASVGETPVLGEQGPSVSAITPLKSALGRVSAKAWAIGAASLGAVVFLILFVTVLGTGTSSVAAGVGTEGGMTLLAGSGDATVKMQGSALVDQQVTSAEQIVTQGDAPEAIKLLSALEQSYPNRADVHRALERAFAAEHDTKSALREADQWLASDPAAAGDRRLADDLRAAALGKDDPEAALGLLETKLGSAGADVLYDLAYGGKPPAAIALRAHQALQSPEVRGHASPAILVSLDLRSATTCEAKRALLPRAREVGDARTLAVLSAYTPTAGCGFLRGHDCWPCLHRDGSLASTISAITTRSTAGP